MAALHGNVIASYDAKTHFSEIVERASAGEEITITKHGVPVAKIGPVKKKKTVEERKAAIARWLEQSNNIKLGGLKIKDLIAEGALMASMVLDASIGLAWCFREEETPSTRELLARMSSEAAVVPGLWFIELANVLTITERKGRITRAEADGFISLVNGFELTVDTESEAQAFAEILPLCRTHQLTSYDAIYLDLAMRRHLPLATLDEPLRRAARKLDVKLLGR